MKKLYSILMLVCMTVIAVPGTAIAGGPHSMSGDHAHKGIHFYGQLYLGFDRSSSGAANSVDRLSDNGNKTRLGLKFKESLGAMTLIGQVEYRTDIVDGTSTNDTTTCSDAGSDCRTLDLHLGNLGLMTGLGYIGVGTYESPYKTMGQYDVTMDTAWAMNNHGGMSDSNFGMAGNMEGMFSYHAKMGPVTLAYMYGLSEKANSNMQSGDYSYGIKFNDFLVSGLEFGVSATHDNEVSAGNPGEGNKKIFGSYKVMPGLSVFFWDEDLESSSTGPSFTNGEGEILTFGAHYTMGNNLIQYAMSHGDANLTAEDYRTTSLSITSNLSKATNFQIGYARQGFDAAGGSVRTWGMGLTHKF
ncbi:MAG: hypothetical protein VYA22_04020 [Pseudomonadota bacterium]|nr:hypothetical protein [Pseudomonadota bacterium]